jgi:hypothetical protein
MRAASGEASGHDWWPARAITALLILLFAHVLAAQSPDSTTAPTPDRRFFRPRDLGAIGGGIAASALLSAYDVRIARWAQSSGVQGRAADGVS